MRSDMFPPACKLWKVGDGDDCGGDGGGGHSTC